MDAGRIDVIDGVALAFRSSRVTEPERAGALALLSEAERGRYAASTPARRDGFLAGRLLLRTLAGEQLGLAPEAVPLVAVCPDCGGPHGRPGIPESDLNLGLAHAGALVIAIAAFDRAVGVDAEPLDGHAGRDAAIRTVAAGAGLPHWTRVEAVLKADGRGLRVDPSLVRIDGGTAAVGRGSARYDLFEPTIDPTVQVAVAVERKR